VIFFQLSEYFAFIILFKKRKEFASFQQKIGISPGVTFYV